MATIQGPAADDDDATTRACGPHGIFCKGLWPLAGARTPLKERAKVARASSCNINVEKPLVFFRIRTARAGRNFENSCRCFSMTYGAIRVIL